ncbi:hypothetical protein D3C74_352480 [compost metagenome]
MEDELYDLVMLAQEGNTEALSRIIDTFLPIIRNTRHKLKLDRQDDLEQTIIEIIIKKVKTYDLSQAPDFTAYCHQILNFNDQSNEKMHKKKRAF